MISVFRRIRRQLMDNAPASSSGRYILYALGEILLVVVGILIALQVNNWNEDRVERQIEKHTLRQISQGMVQDINYMDNLERRLDNLLVSIDEMKEKAHREEVFVDSLYLKKGGDGRWYLLRTGIVYQINSGPYETLKNYGLGIVQDDSLRNELVEFYDFKERRRQTLFNYFHQQYLEEVDDLLSFLGDPFTEEVEGEVRIVSRFPPDLLRNPDFLRFLSAAEERALSQLQNVQTHREDMIGLKGLIDQKLN